MNKTNIIFIIVDSISYKYSWLKSEQHFPKLYKKINNFKNFHNHYAVSHNSRANIGTIMSGVLPSLHKVVNRKQKYNETNIKFIGKKLKDYEIETHYLLNQSLGNKEVQIKDEFHIDSFSSILACTPSLAEFNINGKVFNKIIYDKLDKLKNKNHCFFIHTTDAHEPFQTPNINYFSNKIPLTRNFIIRKNLVNLNMLRRIKSKFFSKERIIRNAKYFSEFPLLKKNVYKVDGPFFTPFRYPFASEYYEKIWSDKKFLSEYKMMHKLASNYQDDCIDKLLNHIENNFRKNTIIILTADHGSNAFTSNNTKKKIGVMHKDILHIPFSILTFDDEIKKEIFFSGNVNNYTSHLDVSRSILSLYNSKYNNISSMLFNLFFEDDRSFKNRYLFAECGDSRLSFNEIKMFNNSFNLHIQSKNSDIVEKLIKKEKILNNIKANDYETYKLYKTKLNDYLQKLSN